LLGLASVEQSDRRRNAKLMVKLRLLMWLQRIKQKENQHLQG
jgi:hypothetical protein